MRFQVVLALCFLVLVNAMPSNKLNHKGDSVKFEARFLDKKFDYEMNRPLQDICADRKVRVLVLIMSGVENFDKRQAIRESWMYDKSNPVDYLTLFLIGHSDDKTLNDKIQEEELKYGDVVRYSGVKDIYHLLPIKTHAALSWQREFCPNVEYLMKTDDDTVVYLKRFDTFVRDEFAEEVKRNPATIFCSSYNGNVPVRDRTSKYYVSLEEFPLPVYPEQCSGYSYLITRQAVRQLLSRTQDVSFLPMEDVLFTGIVASKSGVKLHRSNALEKNIPQELIEERGEPFLSVIMEVPALNISDAYRSLKEMTPKTSNLPNYD